MFHSCISLLKGTLQISSVHPLLLDIFHHQSLLTTINDHWPMDFRIFMHLPHLPLVVAKRPAGPLRWSVASQSPGLEMWPRTWKSCRKKLKNQGNNENNTKKNTCLSENRVPLNPLVNHRHTHMKKHAQMKEIIKYMMNTWRFEHIQTTK